MGHPNVVHIDNLYYSFIFILHMTLDNQQISSVPIINILHTTHTHAENVMLSHAVMQGLISSHCEHVLLMYPIALVTEFNVLRMFHFYVSSFLM